MERVDIADLDREPHPMGVNTERRDVGAAVGTEDLGVVHYELDPGEQFSGGLHTHHDQEEVFVVLEGSATFEHREARTDAEAYDDPRDGTETTEVTAGEVVHFDAGEFQVGRNESDDRVVAVALAAPGRRHDWTDLESFAPCGDCGEVTSHGVREPDESFVIYCNECGHEMRIA